MGAEFGHMGKITKKTCHLYRQPVNLPPMAGSNLTVLGSVVDCRTYTASVCVIVYLLILFLPIRRPFWLLFFPNYNPNTNPNPAYSEGSKSPYLEIFSNRHKNRNITTTNSRKIVAVDRRRRAIHFRWVWCDWQPPFPFLFFLNEENLNRKKQMRSWFISGKNIAFKVYFVKFTFLYGFGELRW